MSAVRRAFVRDAAVYGAGRVAVQALALVTVPVFTRVFSPAEYGVIDSLTMLVLVVTVVASLGLESATQRSYFDYPADDVRSRRAVLATGWWTLVATSTIAVGLAVVAAPLISRAMFGEDDRATVVAIALGTAPVLLLTNFCLEVLRVRGLPVRYSALAFTAAVLSVGSALVLTLAWRATIEAYYLGLLGGGLAGLAAGVLATRGWIRLAFDRRELRTMLRFGLPLVPVAAATWVLQSIDRFFLLRFSPLSEVGLYGVGARVANLLLLLVAAFALAWSPFALDLHARDPEEERRVRARALVLAAAALGFVAVTLGVFAREIVAVVAPPAFARGWEAVALLSASVLFIGLNTVVMTGISIARRTGYFARYAFYAALVNIALNFALIPPFGMVGAAAATAMAYAVLFGAYYRRAQRLDPAPFDRRGLATVFAVAIAVTAAGSALNALPWEVAAAPKVALLALFPALLHGLRVVDLRGLVRVVA